MLNALTDYDDAKVQKAHTADSKPLYLGNPKLSDVKDAAV